MWLRLGMFLVENFLSDMFGEDLVEHVVHGQGEARLVDQQLLHQEGVQVVRIHNIIPRPANRVLLSVRAVNLS